MGDISFWLFHETFKLGHGAFILAFIIGMWASSVREQIEQKIIIMRIAIDASRNRSGGTIAHLDGILSNIPDDLQSSLEIHIWSYKACLDKLLIINGFTSILQRLEKSIFHQTFWQRFIFPKELERRRCDILFKTTASSICPFEPSVTLSQDMLPFEPGESKRFGVSIARIRLKILQALYIRSLRSSQGVIFLTNYASEMIQRKTGKLNEYRIIPHGVPDFLEFLMTKSSQKFKMIVMENI